MGKKHKKQVFNPPIRYPKKLAGVIQQVEVKHNQDLLRETNNTLNLVTSAYNIVLHEFYEFNEEQLNSALDKVLEQLELCGKELVTVDQLMDLCTEYGLNVTHTADKLDEFGTLMMHKATAFKLLDEGITEVEDIAKKGNMSSRLASAFRWQYNKIKYGKDYKGDVEMISKRELCYALFDKGATISQVVKETDLMKTSVTTYYGSWKKDTLAELTTEEAAPYLAGEKELWQIKQEKNSKGANNEVVEQVPTVQKQPKTETTTTTETRSDAPIDEPKQEAVTIAVSPTPIKGKLRKKVVIDGEYAQYRPCNTDLVDVEISGQILTMTKEEMLALAEELPQVVADQDMWKGGLLDDRR